MFTDIEISFDSDMPSGSFYISLSANGGVLNVHAPLRWHVEDDAALLALDPYLADAIRKGYAAGEQGASDLPVREDQTA